MGFETLPDRCLRRPFDAGFKGTVNDIRFDFHR